LLTSCFPFVIVCWFQWEKIVSLLRKIIGVKDDTPVPSSAILQSSVSLQLQGLLLRPHERTMDGAYYAAATSAVPHYTEHKLPHSSYDQSLEDAAARIMTQCGGPIKDLIHRSSTDIIHVRPLYS